MTTTAKGAGSLRQRRPGVWEIRVAAGTDPVTGRVIQRSVTFHGNAAEAEAYRRDLAGEYRQRRAATRAAPLLTIGELLEHRFRRLRDQAGVPGASLHRLRHNVATFLVARGEIHQAQARLGHRDAATTLREYAYALPLTDGKAADAINDHLDHLGIGADEPKDADTEPRT